MTSLLVALLGIISGSSDGSTGLLRQDRQDTIYVLQGDEAALAALHRDVGVNWTGGSAIDDDSSDGELRYWAFSDRTAAESRALMMPAIFGGLDLSFEPYEEAKQHPIERGKLDQIAMKCGVAMDPFFITPKRSVEISLAHDAAPKLRACLEDGARIDVQLPIASAR